MLKINTAVEEKVDYGVNKIIIKGQSYLRTKEIKPKMSNTELQQIAPTGHKDNIIALFNIY